MPRRTAVLITLVASLSACASEAGVPGRRRDGGGGDSGPGAQPIDGCDSSQDADGDGIADLAEGMADPDGDGVPADRDLDSDGDGMMDVDEHHAFPLCTRPDSDSDGNPDWLDSDSDNDGLSDLEEHGTFSTDPYARDTDGDGVTDLGETRGTMTDPTDPSSTISPDDFFVVLPYLGLREMRTLRFGTNIQQADVYFLIDTTGSMGPPIANVRSSLSRISGELSTRIPDVQMGVGHFDDFPFSEECGIFDFSCGEDGNYGSPGDVAYENLQDITDVVSDVQNALNRLDLGRGNDSPESQVEALYQTATGEGGSWAHATGAHSIARRACPARPDEIGMRRGYPCFRPGSLPIIVMVSDVEFHNGAGGGAPYRGISPPPHSFAQAASALNGIGARMIGVAIGGGGRADQEAMARMTGTVNGSGTPLVYDAADGTVSDAIIEGIGDIVGGTPQDVSTGTENVPGNPGDVDATQFIKSIVAIEGYSSAGVPGANPGVSYTSHDETVFYGVVPGTQVEFAVDFHNDFEMPHETAVIFRARIVVLGNGVARLDERQVYIIVPPEGSVVLI